MTKFYIVGDYAEAGFSLLSLDPKTMAECKQSIAWQNAPATPCNTPFHICTAHPSERAAFVSVDSGQVYTVNRGAFTDAAYARAVDAIWPRDLAAEVKAKAPGFYTERDGGYWYIVTPDHGDRIGEDFRDRDDARRFLLWCAGDALPDGWSIGEVKRIAADVDCGQGFPATAWVRTIAKHFPARAAELTAEA